MNETKWVVDFADHDCGSKGGTIVRDTKERAEFTAKLMQQYGYRDVLLMPCVEIEVDYS